MRFVSVRQMRFQTYALTSDTIQKHVINKLCSKFIHIPKLYLLHKN